MSYSSIAVCAQDTEFTKRVTAALVQEGHAASTTISDGTYNWEAASAGDIEAAYASALAAENPNPGGDESVITDGMILSYVQANPPA